MMEQMLGNLDPNVVYVCIAVLVVGIILTLIKKAFFLAIIMVVLFMGATMLIPMAKEFQENYSIGINDDEQLEMVVNGKTFTFGGEDNGIQDINIERKKTGEYTLEIKYEDGGIATFTAPGYMRDTIIKYIKNNGFKYDLFE